MKFKKGIGKVGEIIFLLRLEKKSLIQKIVKAPAEVTEITHSFHRQSKKKASSENFNRHQRAENRGDWRLADAYAQLYLHIKISTRAWTQSCKRRGSMQGDDLIKFLPGLHYLLQFLISSAKLKLAGEETHFKASVLYLLHTTPQIWAIKFTDMHTIRGSKLLTICCEQKQFSNW